MRNKVIAALLGTILTLPVLAADKPLVRSETTEARATVTAIDLPTRLVTLKGPDGKAFQVEAGPAVQQLDKVKVGDVVLVAYTESVAFQVVPKDQTPGGASTSANRVPGGAQVGHQVTTSFKLASVDPVKNVIWVTLPNGDSKEIHVQDPEAQKRLKNLSPGNVVSVTYSESLAVRLEKATK